MAETLKLALTWSTKVAARHSEVRLRPLKADGACGAAAEGAGVALRWRQGEGGTGGRRHDVCRGGAVACPARGKAGGGEKRGL